MLITHNNKIISFENKIVKIDTITPPPTPSIVTDNLFIELNATNYTGGNWIDETVNGNDATINGSTWIPDDGGIFDFDGLNDTMTILDKTNLRLSTTQQRTVQMWVKFDALPIGSNRMVFFGKLSSSFGFDGYWGGINSIGNVVIATNGTSISKTSNSTLSVSINNWYLFTFITQITGTLNTTKAYVNETEYITTQHGVDGYNEANNLTIGYLTPPLTGLGLISYLNGKVGAVYFYTKGLSPEEISINFNATKSKYAI
jgi:hypothetical protein